MLKHRYDTINFPLVIEYSIPSFSYGSEIMDIKQMDTGRLKTAG